MRRGNLCGLMMGLALIVGAASAGAQQQRALLVCVGKYAESQIPSFVPDGTQVDITTIREALKVRGITNITELTDQKASGDNIRAALQKMRDESKPGDTLVFYFSGHGGRIGADFSLCPFDANRADGKRDIKDTELRDWVNALPVSDQFPKPNVTLMLDCCFSEFKNKAKGNPRRRSKFLPRMEEASAKLVNVIPEDKAVVLRASREDEEAQQEDLYRNGEWVGLFTFEMSVALKNANAETTYAQIMARIQNGIKSQLENLFHGSFHQTPEMDGSEAQQNRRLFTPLMGRKEALPNDPVANPVNPPASNPVASAAKPEVPVTLLPPPPAVSPYTLIASVKGGSVTLNRGRMASVVVGSEYSLYSAGATDFSPARRVGKIRITNVGEESSQAAIVEGAGRIAVDFRAVEIAHAAPAPSKTLLRVRVEAPQDCKEAIEQGLRATEMAEPCRDNPALILQVMPAAGGLNANLYHADGVKTIEAPIATLAAASPDKIVAEVKTRLDNLFVLQSLLTLQNPNPGFAVHVKTDRSVYKVGQYPQIRVRVDGQGIAQAPARDQEAYLSLIYIEASGAATVLFPNPYHTDNKVSCYKDILISSENSIPLLGFRLVSSPPMGCGNMIAIVTREPINWNTVDKTPLEEGLRKITGKSLRIEGPQIQGRPTLSWGLARVTLTTADSE